MQVGTLLDQVSVALIRDQLMECVHFIDALVSPVQAEPEPVDGVVWVNPSKDLEREAPGSRPAHSAVSILARKNARQVTLNCHAVKDCDLSITDRLSFGVDREKNILMIRVDPNGMFPITIHRNEKKEINGYQVASQILINLLGDLGVPANMKIPLQFDDSTKTWIGQISEAFPVGTRETKPRQQALIK